MTDMTPEEINDMLARWVGFEGSGLNNTFNDPPNSNPYHCHILPTPDYFQSNAAMDLLGVLAKKGHSPDLYHSVDSDGFGAWYCNSDPEETYHVSQDISEAICHACLGVIEREGRE